MSTATFNRIPIYWLPILIGVLPVAAANICYVIASQAGHVPLCIPYLSGCTSISSTGRALPEALIFKGAIIPSAVLMMAYWALVYRWFTCFENKPGFGIRSIPVLGIIAAVFLIVYAVALGAIGEEYRNIRRVGVTLFFGLTFLAQLTMTAALHRLYRSGRVTLPAYLPKLYIAGAVVLLSIGLASTPLSWFLPQTNNIVEWNFAIIMYLYFLPTYWLWRHSGFYLHVATQTSG
ncbi:MAG: Frag1/DRAM/Sfk1 family protein [Gammaproteobacteria bacterium]|nr:Frag1/DRAM/Sfk1 family protein [Gammaproteobacteria bacterium]MDH5802960.1 Frag1/DRAM/Sfk1 family protein [Gammaproteobacteria bacterium]